MNSDVVIIIPSRIGSTRLNNKPLVKIGDKCLIEHAVLNLKPDFADNLYVATDSKQIADIVTNLGAVAVMTDENCLTGSDRVFEAYKIISAKREVKYIINVQGDMPFIRPKVINQIIERLKSNDCDIVTSVVKVGADIAKDESNVKVVIDNNRRALYFSRSLIPHGSKEFHYHVGIYGFHSGALGRFVNLKQGKYELLEKLEQLRALENAMSIGVCLSDEIPLSIDTQADLDKAIDYYKNKIL